MTTIETMVYRSGDEALEMMKSLINLAHAHKGTDDYKLKSEIMRGYSLARDSAMALGVEVSSLPKKIRYESIRRIETPEERERITQERMRLEVDETMGKVRDFYKERMARYQEIGKKIADPQSIGDIEEAYKMLKELGKFHDSFGRKTVGREYI